MSTLIRLIVNRSNVTIKKLTNLNLKTNLLKNLRNQNVLIIDRSIYSSRFAANNKSIKCPNKLLKLKTNYQLINYKLIRTTDPNRIPPIFWLIIRPVVNVAAALGKLVFL